MSVAEAQRKILQRFHPLSARPSARLKARHPRDRQGAVSCLRVHRYVLVWEECVFLPLDACVDENFEKIEKWTQVAPDEVKIQQDDSGERSEHRTFTDSSQRCGGGWVDIAESQACRFQLAGATYSRMNLG